MIGALGKGMLTIADGPEMPSVDDFLPDPFVFQGTPFAINRIILVRILATVIMLLVLGITASRAKLIPSRWQGAVEWLIEFVRDNIVYQVMGELRGKRYVPMITTVFCTLLVFNLCGIIPGFNIAASATITLPLVFAMWCFCQYWIAGIREKGLGHFLRDEIFPKGVPAPIYILLSPIQLLELLIIRPFSLTIRLFANMVSGHLILALCLSATQYFLIDVVNKVFMPFGVVTFAAGMFMFLFEALVACLQAYIFAILTTAYINMSYPEISACGFQAYDVLNIFNQCGNGCRLDVTSCTTRYIIHNDRSLRNCICDCSIVSDKSLLCCFIIIRSYNQ